MNYDDWFHYYSPVKNNFDPNASFDGYLFETYGEELSYVKAQVNGAIWTIIQGDDEKLYLTPGYHLVNRLGYFVCNVSFKFPEEEYDKHEIKL